MSIFRGARAWAAFACSVAFLVSAPSALGATFSFTGGEQTYVVPAGVSQIEVEAVGAAGLGNGGSGARVKGRLAVVPGQTLYVEVGAPGACGGGGEGGAAAGPSGWAGGGATDLRTVSVSDGAGGLCSGVQSTLSLQSRLLVAAGGGGGSGVATRGGDAATAGSDGTDGSTGGGAGTATAGGAGGSAYGLPGTLGFGGGNPGCCPWFGGGGGGGGLYGGGTGGAGMGDGSGGGGGSNLVPSGGTAGLAGGPAGMTITPLHELTVAVDTDGQGSGYMSSSPAGVDCGPPSSTRTECTAAFPDGAEVTLTANPDPGSEFSLSGSSCDGSGSCKVVMSEDRSVSATFSDPKPQIESLRVTPKRFAADSSPTALRRARGASIKLALSENARVRFRVRSNPIRRSGADAPSQPRSFTRELSEGQSSVGFTGTLGKRTFKPGSYVVIARATDVTGHRSAKERAAFEVVAGG